MAPLMRRRVKGRSCRIHGDNGCENQGDAQELDRATEKRRWRADSVTDAEPMR